TASLVCNWMKSSSAFIFSPQTATSGLQCHWYIIVRYSHRHLITESELSHLLYTCLSFHATLATLQHSTDYRLYLLSSRRNLYLLGLQYFGLIPFQVMQSV